MDDRTYRDKVIRPWDVAEQDGSMRELVFEKCHVEGPAVLVPMGCSFISNTFEADSSAMFWEIDPSTRPVIVGAFHVVNCTFEECRFRNVGFAGPPELIAQFREGTN